MPNYQGPLSITQCGKQFPWGVVFNTGLAMQVIRLQRCTKVTDAGIASVASAGQLRILGANKLHEIGTLTIKALVATCRLGRAPTKRTLHGRKSFTAIWPGSRPLCLLCGYYANMSKDIYMAVVGLPLLHFDLLEQTMQKYKAP